eukprot:jgi/Ulvmu1/5197/UM021_0214.1
MLYRVQAMLRSLDDGTAHGLLPCLRMVSKRFRVLADSRVVRAKLSFSPSSAAWQSYLLQRLENLDELHADLRGDGSTDASSLLLMLNILRARPGIQKLNVTFNDCDQLCDQWAVGDSEAMQHAMQHLSHLRTLSLGGYGSVSMSTRILCSALQHVSPLKELLVGVAIGNRGIHNLAPCIQGNQSVVRLNLSGTAIGDIGAVNLAACLTENLTLEDLDLSHNSMGAEGATAIAMALARNRRLARLCLAHNALADHGASAFGGALGNNISLRSLDLQYNSIGLAGIDDLSRGLQANGGLTKLNLSGNDAQAGGARVLAQALAVNTVLLELSICETRLHDSVHALAFGLTPNTVLQSLSLSNNCIGRVGASALATVLARSVPSQLRHATLRPLVHLDLSHNSLGDAGLAEMASSLRGAYRLKTLHLVNCDIGFVGADTLAASMEHLSLESVNLNRNYVADMGAASLGLALQRHGKCNAMHLQFNGVRDSGAMALAVALKLVPSMRLVDLRGNAFPYTQKKIRTILEGCEREVQFLH